MSMHESAVYRRPVRINVMLNDGMFKGYALPIDTKEYHNFSERYMGDLDAIVVTGRLQFEIIKGLQYYTKKTSNNYWCHLDEQY